MAYSFVEKHINLQAATAYAFYMLIGSYFHRAICENPLLEERLFLHYKDLPDIKQVDLEKRLLRDIEDQLAGLEDDLSLMNCIVTLSQVDDFYEILFFTGFENIKVAVNKSGQYRIWVSAS